MPRGVYTNHKGRNRRFTNPEELEEQRRREEKERKWRAERGEESSSEEEDAAGDAKKDSASESSSESESESGEESKGKGVEKLIEVENPNRVQKKVKKLSKLNEVVEQNVKPELSRKERYQMADEEITLKYYTENVDLRKNVANDQYIHIHIHNLILKPPPWLEGFESPFKWGLKIHTFDLVSWNIPRKLCDYGNQGAFYGFERLGFLLTLLFMKKLLEVEHKVCEKKMKDKIALRAQNILQQKRVVDNESDGSEDKNATEDEGEKEVDEYSPEKCYALCREAINEMASNEGDIMYGRIGPALEHVLQTTRAHIMFYNGNIAESQELARNIQPPEEMSQECKAGFEGLKAKCIMSMYQNYKVVLPYLHEAMQLDPKFGYWPYLFGKVLRRARREFLEGSIEEEISFFEKAVSLERNPKFLVFLGQAYQEMAVFQFKSRGSLESRETISLGQLYRNAVACYSECWSLKSDAATIARRISDGMGKMREKYIDKVVAKEALVKAVELSPKKITHLNLGKFYYYHEMNDEKALECFQKCKPGDFGTSLDLILKNMIRRNLIKDPDYNPHDILLLWLKFGVNAERRYRIHCDAVWYFLIYKRDVITAAKYFWKVFKKDKESIRAKIAMEYKSYAFCVEGTINLIELLFNEILLLQNRRNEQLKNKKKQKKQKMTLLEERLQKLIEKYPYLSNLNPRPDWVKDLKQEVTSSIAAKRRRRHGSGNRQSESNQNVELVNWRSNRLSEGSGEEVPHRQGDGNREFKPWMSYAGGNSGRNYMRYSGRGEDEERNRDRRRNSESQSNWSTNSRTSDVREGSSRGYSRDDRQRHSESQSDSSTARSLEFREGNHNQNSGRIDFNNRGGNDRQFNSYNNNRYDVTITDWRRENREK